MRNLGETPERYSADETVAGVEISVVWDDRAEEYEMYFPQIGQTIYLTDSEDVAMGAFEAAAERSHKYRIPQESYKAVQLYLERQR